MAELKYQSGFGNEFATEALKGALRHQTPPFGGGAIRRE